MDKKWCSLFVLHKKCLTFVIANATGTLDEWLSQRSAKPCTAVRIRQVPQESLNDEALFLFLWCRFLFWNYLCYTTAKMKISVTDKECG